MIVALAALLAACDGGPTDETDVPDPEVPLGEASIVVRGTPSVWAGAAVAAVGDVDGDGSGDVWVGAPAGSAAWLFAGGATGELREDDALLRFSGEATSDWAGGTVAGGADLTGDEVLDLVVSAVSYDGLGTDDGAIYILSGISRGDVAAADAVATIAGAAALDAAGTGLATGDLTGDGAGDLVVGAPGNDAGGADAGTVYVLAGPIRGEVAVSAAVTSLQGSDGRHGAPGVGDALGYVLDVGDADGDGQDDLAVSAGGADVLAADGGDALVFYGPLAPGHFGTGVADVRVRGAVESGFLGEPVALPGDLDGDGTGDLVVSQNGALPFELAVFFGAAGELSLVDADATFEPEGAEDGAGYAVSGGDVDGDGAVDLVIGAPWADATGGEAGSAYVVFGPLVGGRTALADAHQRLRGEAAGDGAGYAVAVGAAGEVLVGAPFARGSGGSVYVLAVEAP